MTNYIASELTDRHSRDVDRKEMVNFVREYSDRELIEVAQPSNSSGFDYKIREFLLPTFTAQERNLAKKILLEKGIDYKVIERKHQIQKEKTRQEMREFVTNPFNTFYKLIVKSNGENNKMMNLKDKMANEIEQFTSPGKYAIDKFFDSIKKMSSIQKDIPRYKPSEKSQNQDYKSKQNYNRIQNK